MHSMMDEITPKEIDRAKAQLKTSIVMNLESASSRADQIARQYLAFGEVPEIKTLIARIEALACRAIAAALGTAQLGAFQPPPGCKRILVTSAWYPALNQANAAMGGVALKSIQFDAAGTGGIFGQAYQPGMAWPKLNVTMFSRVMDYDGGALRQDIAQNRAEPTGGGALPLMGTGDWNDGMNRVGHEGRGESVWLGWLLCSLMVDFIPLAQTLFTVVQFTLSGSPANFAACRAGA